MSSTSCTFTTKQRVTKNVTLESSFGALNREVHLSNTVKKCLEGILGLAVSLVPDTALKYSDNTSNRDEMRLECASMHSAEICQCAMHGISLAEMRFIAYCEGCLQGRCSVRVFICKDPSSEEQSAFLTYPGGKDGTDRMRPSGADDIFEQAGKDLGLRDGICAVSDRSPIGLRLMKAEVGSSIQWKNSNGESIEGEVFQIVTFPFGFSD